MRHLYENLVSAIEMEIKWFSNLEELLNHAGAEPTIVIVDLDAVGSSASETKLEHIRGAFSQSELIALSSQDSSQAAMQSVRAGFADFLLKPASPEELSWSIRKCQQSQDLLRQLAPTDDRAEIVRAASQISAATTANLVKLYTLQYLQKTLGTSGCAWIALEESTLQPAQVSCSIPRKISPSEVLFEFPQETFLERFKKDNRTEFYEKGKFILSCQHHPKNILFCWGLKKRPSPSTTSRCLLLLDHSELSLFNIQKFDEIKQQTFIDDLTGLYNSRYLKFAITNAILRCKNSGQAFGVLFIDIDHFKKVNDEHGHVVGSELLVTIGRTIRYAVRNVDPVFRYGGDEFVVLLHDTTTAGAKEIAERIRKNIERRLFVVKNQRLRATVSIGIATYPEHASERETLLRLADDAMYSAKRTTRNAVHLALGDAPKTG
ncbi:MAG: diguanylate cyclase [Deltaproteobacteria bacterium]|nr:diguanylate cyclase [Deltaproteobacteria bacterium]